MNSHTLLSLAVAATTFVCPALRAQLVSNFSVDDTAAILFTGTGDKIAFPDTGFDFHFIDGPLAGLDGKIEGEFSIGAIVSGSLMGLGYDSAPVSGTGQFRIFDGSTWLDSTLTWADVLRVGTVGSLNAGGTLNLSGFSYSGSNVNLQALASNTTASTSVTFQFIPQKTLGQLTTDGTTHSTSYSGTLYAAIPEPEFYAIAMVGFVGLVVGIRRFRQRIVHPAN
jgi:hypothetical protein